MDQTITLGAGIIAVIAALKRQVPQVNGVITFVIALALGGAAGYLGLLGTTDILTGLFIGAASVGAVTVADRASGR